MPDADVASLILGIARLSQGKYALFEMMLLAMDASLATTLTSESPATH